MATRGASGSGAGRNQSLLVVVAGVVKKQDLARAECCVSDERGVNAGPLLPRPGVIKNK